MAIRRTSPGFTRGSSSFRGVTQHKSGASLPTPAPHGRSGDPAPRMRLVIQASVNLEPWSYGVWLVTCFTCY